MAFNGSGTFVRLYNWVNDAAANIKIRADRMDNEMDGFATGLSSCITRDGQTTVTANLPMAGFRHTGVSDATSRNQYAAFGQVQDGKAAWVDGGGTADAITASYPVPITALVDGQLCFVRATAANATATPTFSPNGLTARTIVKNGGQALVAGDIGGDNHELILRYDLTNTRWELLNPRNFVPFTQASTATAAYLDLAEDTDNGTNRARLIAPAALAADATITLPSSTGTLATLAGTETFTGKTYDAAVFTNNPTGTIEAGTYTPTLTNVTNVAASTAYTCQWMRVGSVVTVSGLVDIDPTTASIATELGMSLPVASNLGAQNNLGGAAYATATAAQGYGISGDAVNDRASFTGIPASNANIRHAFTFSYRII